MPVVSPVAFGWFVESSPRVAASAKQRPPDASTTVAASTSSVPSGVENDACQPAVAGSS